MWHDVEGWSGDSGGWSKGCTLRQERLWSRSSPAGRSKVRKQFKNKNGLPDGAIFVENPPPPNLEDDGTEFTKAFIRRGRKEPEAQGAADPQVGLRARLAASELDGFPTNARSRNC